MVRLPFIDGGQPIFANLLFSKFRSGNSKFFLPIFVYFCQCRTCYFEILGVGIARFPPLMIGKAPVLLMFGKAPVLLMFGKAPVLLMFGEAPVLLMFGKAPVLLMFGKAPVY